MSHTCIRHHESLYRFCVALVACDGDVVRWVGALHHREIGVDAHHLAACLWSHGHEQQLKVERWHVDGDATIGRLQNSL